MEQPAPWEIRKAAEIGRKGTARYIWRVCRCGSTAWVQVNKYRTGQALQCKACANRQKSENQKGSKAPWWKGGRVDIGGGYVGVYVHEGDPLHGMATKQGYVREHRLIMARALGRPLLDEEIVHHKNGKKNDNRIENLELKKNHVEHMAEHSAGYRDGFDRGYQDGLRAARRESGKG